MTGDGKVLQKVVSLALAGKNSHVGARNVFEGLAWKLAGARPEGAPHTAFQLANPMIFWQEWVSTWLDGGKPKAPRHARTGWPGADAPGTRREWEQTVRRFRRGLVVQPDLVFVSSARLGIVSDRVWGAPDLVVEVLPPRPRLGSLDERLGWFAQYGVRECWLIHQIERTVEVVGFGDGAITSRPTFGEAEGIQSRVLPAFNGTPGSILTVT